MFDPMAHHPKKRKILDPPLISMIAVLSMLILFLVAGTVFGTVTIEIPTPYELAVSQKKEEVVVAPHVIFVPSGFRLSFGDPVDYPLDIFNQRNKEAQPLYRKIKADVDRLAQDRARAKITTPMELNVVAERTSSYKVIFDVLKGLREMGFANILFVSKLKEQGP